MSSCPVPAALTPSEEALKELLLPHDIRNIYLYAFSRRTLRRDGSTTIGHPLPVAAVSQILTNTDYFAKLLTSGFAESNETHPIYAESSNAIRQHASESEYDYDSDSDLDEGEDAPDVQGEEDAGPSLRRKEKGRARDGAEDTAGTRRGGHIVNRVSSIRHIQLPNIAYRTLRACIFYLYTGKVNFLPLHSACTDRNPDREGAPACSPKSMYRLAECYGIPALQDLAYKAISKNLFVSNIVQETFSTFYWRYDRLREVTVSVLAQHYHDKDVQASMRDVIAKVVSGQLPYIESTLISLLGIRMAQQPLPPVQAYRLCLPLPCNATGIRNTYKTSGFDLESVIRPELYED
ncbi:hypothetical protein C8Q77DRAFT_1155265 [Trametes polyzona]|nr:hypothetical protein C8Q77DRAFT_1155265 [Trametes polyzona]